MTKLSSYLVAGGIACATILGSAGAFAGTVEDELARIDHLLGSAPSQSSSQWNSPTNTAVTLRASAAASLRAGDEQMADTQAKLALHELGEDGISVNSDEMQYSCIEGCYGPYFLPSVSAAEIARGATAAVRMVSAGQGSRYVSVDSDEVASDATKLAQAQTDK
jgi:hypothetical protein